ncbi:hypothetical protein PIB30_029474 [Stylosanthes scabra]|uniref:Uncharacterized protein n=1 Tax=Stylosanthes scabra TaxID=79078 RepID=A0ABU6QAR4_9FABA|nr:hypothetical protein [Stylosanthes scabra]
MEDLSMFRRPRTVALEDENPGTYGTVLIYPLNRLVECGFVGDTAVNPWVGIFYTRQGFARETRIHNLFGFRYDDLSLSFSRTQGNPEITLFATPRTASYQRHWTHDTGFETNSQECGYGVGVNNPKL